MARIETTSPEAATGELVDVYWRISKARGGVANILRAESLNPAALAAHVELYLAVMFEASPLSRPEREAVAVAVSATNGCEYDSTTTGGVSAC